MGKKNHNKKTVHKMHFKKMRKTLSEISSLRKSDNTDKALKKFASEYGDAAADKSSLFSKKVEVEAKAAATTETDAEDGDKKTEVLGKAILDPESNPCKM